MKGFAYYIYFTAYTSNTAQRVHCWQKLFGSTQDTVVITSEGEQRKL